MKIDTPLRNKIETLAKKERRTIADQAAYLIEKGLEALETTTVTQQHAVQEIQG